jgi:fructose-1,6-bisphosphatase-3
MTPLTGAASTDLALLRSLQNQFPTADHVVAEIARLSALLQLPKGTVHVISDIHGDDVKLRHVINNASGTLRPMVDRLFANTLSAEERQQLLTLIFYPRETMERLAPSLADPPRMREFCRRTLGLLFDIVRALARQFSLRHVLRVFPAEYAELLRELMHDPGDTLRADYHEAVLDSLLRHDRGLHAIRLTVRVVRDLTIDELIIDGDCFDRGPRGDRVVEYLQKQPNVLFIWGNHDAAWLGACLGQEALIAHVLRISCRYRRLSALEEGYGITLQPLEHLVRVVYANDPASCYPCKGTGLREAVQMSRLQKAAAVMQYKLEGQMFERNPEWELDHRRLLHRIDHAAGTITIDDKTYPLKDRNFPTIDPAQPYELSVEERACMDRLRKSFLSSRKLYNHMQYLNGLGTMYLKRDHHLIFHGCLPVDDKGNFLPMIVDGQPLKGRPLFDALAAVIPRMLTHRRPKDVDLAWYLWCGPLSPLFGKDRITTLENDLIAAPETHVETKNPFFQLIHEVWFCDKVLREFDVSTEHGLIVNGHVPVKIEKGENPLKRSGKAITIDGAFSQAYGDHGYTLVLEPDRTCLAKHHHFESVEAAVEKGADIIPEVEVIRKWASPHRVADTERGAEIRGQIALLEMLLSAYRTNRLRPAVV